MLPMWLLKILPFDGICLSFIAIGAGVMGVTFLLSFFLTRVFGMSVIQTGLTISSMPLAAMVFSVIAGPLSSKYGSRLFVCFGMLLSAISCFLFSSLNTASTRIDVVLRLVLLGSGLGLAMTSLMSSMVRNIPDEKIGIGSGITNMARALGSVLGIAIIVTFLNSNISNQMNEAKHMALGLVKADTVLNNQVKDQFSLKLNEIEFSRDGSKLMNSDDIINIINHKEKETLSNITEAASENIEMTFAEQKEEVEKLWPKIEQIFAMHTSFAFSSTFKFASLIMILGIVFGLLSDKA